MNHNFKELKIWQKGIDLVDASYDFASILPKEGKYNLVSQITRCACFVPLNIAEGYGKRTSHHFAEYLSTSLASCFGLETHIIIREKRDFGKSEMRKELTEKLSELKNMIYTFREKIVAGPKS